MYQVDGFLAKHLKASFAPLHRGYRATPASTMLSHIRVTGSRGATARARVTGLAGSRQGPRRAGPSHARYVVVAAADSGVLDLTEENVVKVLDEVRPYLVSDGGDVEFVELDGCTVYLKLVGACSSCPSSTTTMTMGIERRLKEKIPDILEIVQLEDENTGLELTPENVDTVLGEIRPYLVGTGGGSLELDSLDGPIVKVRISGPAASVMTVRVAVTQKLRERIPSIAAVQLLGDD